MADAFIFDAVRTPRGKGKSSGSLHTVKAVDLLAGALGALRDRNGLDTAEVEDVTMGCVTQTSEQGACIARTAVLRANYDERVPAVTLNRFCGSGLEAINGAAAKVASGFMDLVIAGGVESMSRVKMGSDGGAIWDPAMEFDYGIVPQGISADLLATINGISRKDVDEYALRSQQLAARAVARGAFKRSIAPVIDMNGRVLLDHDELPRASTTLEGLNNLKAAFEMMGVQFGIDALTHKRYPHVEHIDHIHTAGNSSGIVDGAAAMLIGSKDAGERLGLTPRARIRSIAAIGDEPVIMLSAPAPASKRALKKAGMQASDIDLWEINEAFAAVVLYTVNELGIDMDRVNVNGGAIALGHPLGATGAMILNTVLDEMEAQDKGTGLATLCIGGGMGIATVIERV